MTPQHFAAIVAGLGLSHEQLGDALGVSDRMVRFMQSGERPITVSTQRRLQILLYEKQKQLMELARTI